MSMASFFISSINMHIKKYHGSDVIQHCQVFEGLPNSTLEIFWKSRPINPFSNYFLQFKLVKECKQRKHNRTELDPMKFGIHNLPVFMKPVKL